MKMQGLLTKEVC